MTEGCVDMKGQKRCLCENDCPTFLCPQKKENMEMDLTTPLIIGLRVTKEQKQKRVMKKIEIGLLAEVNKIPIVKPKNFRDKIRLFLIAILGYEDEEEITETINEIEQEEFGDYKNLIEQKTTEIVNRDNQAERNGGNATTP